MLLARRGRGSGQGGKFSPSPDFERFNTIWFNQWMIVNLISIGRICIYDLNKFKMRVKNLKPLNSIRNELCLVSFLPFSWEKVALA